MDTNAHPTIEQAHEFGLEVEKAGASEQHAAASIMASGPSGAIAENIKGKKLNISVEVYQQDWIPGFAAFRNDNAIAEGKAHVVLNVGGFLSTAINGDISAPELPYFIAESVMHEVVHALEAWAGVEFSEERVGSLIQKYEKMAQSEK